MHKTGKQGKDLSLSLDFCTQGTFKHINLPLMPQSFHVSNWLAVKPAWVHTKMRGLHFPAKQEMWRQNWRHLEIIITAVDLLPVPYALLYLLLCYWHLCTISDIRCIIFLHQTKLASLQTWLLSKPSQWRSRSLLVKVVQVCAPRAPSRINNATLTDITLETWF